MSASSAIQSATVTAPTEPFVLTRAQKNAPSQAVAGLVTPTDAPQVTAKPAAKKKVAKEAKQYKWIKTEPEPRNITWKGSMPHYDEVQTHLDLFRMFITEDILSNIVDKTNLNAMRKKNLALKLSLEELRRFLGVQMLMSILKLPAVRMYWENGIRYSPVADTMSRDRFISLRSFFHICDDTLMIPKGEVGHDKLFKIRRLYDAFRENLKKIDPEEIQSIDEQMIPFKGRIGFRQYLKDKPHSWGVKVFTRAGISGIVYDIEIYTGKGAVEISELGQGTDVVLRLVENLPRFMNLKLFFDNFYTGIDLIHKLRVEYGIESCGTIRSNRMRGAVLDTDANMKKKGRGSVDFRFERHSEVSVVKWYDNKPVHLASSYCAVTPIDKCQRWDGTTRKYVKVDPPPPRIVRDYNKSMGGVDLADMFLELYRIDIRSKKWYMRIVYYFFDMAVNNAWLIHRRQCKQINVQHMSLLYLKKDIARGLVITGVSQSPRVGRPSLSVTKRNTTTSRDGMPSESVRFDQTSHFPDTTEKGRCRYEKCVRGGTSRIMCSKCKVRLCLKSDRNCFTNFHLK